MNLAIATPPLQTPFEAFKSASASYNKALDSITFEPNEKVDVRAAVSDALTNAQQAVATLTPFATDTSDMFTGRNAASSIAAATAGVSALNTALQTLLTPGAGMPQIPVSTFLSIAQKSLTTADSILWQE